MSVEEDSFHKPKNTDDNVQDSAKPRSPSALCFGHRGFSCSWTCFLSHRLHSQITPPKSHPTAQNLMKSTAADYSPWFQRDRPPDFSHRCESSP